MGDAAYYQEHKDDPDEWGEGGFHAWLLHGLARKWITDVACATHDGTPMTDAEMDDVGWEGHDDDCIYIVRILEDNIGPA